MQEGITRLGPYRANWNSVFAVLYRVATLQKIKCARIFVEGAPTGSQPVALLEISDGDRAEQLAKTYALTLQAAVSYFLGDPIEELENPFPGNDDHVQYCIRKPIGIHDKPEIPGLVVQFG